TARLPRDRHGARRAGGGRQRAGDGGAGAGPDVVAAGRARPPGRRQRGAGRLQPPGLGGAARSRRRDRSAAGGGASAGLTTGAESRAMAIEHVFVLMLENRSFDHLLGWAGLTGPDAVTGEPTAAAGLSGDESNELPDGRRVAVSAGADYEVTFDPGHGF